jgi:putative ABC transport system permease protein
MIKNYFKIAFRSFRRHKLFTLINVIGLSIGISSAVVIYLIVHFDFTFDKYHKNTDHVYRVVSQFTFQGDKSYNSGVCGPLAQNVNQVAGVESSVALYSIDPDVFVQGKGSAPVKFKDQDKVALAGSDYFKMFNYKWLAGSPKTALADPDKVVLTSEKAKKYFPGLDYSQMIGKTVTYDTLKTTVTGIVETPTENTDLGFQDLISYSTGTTKANYVLNSDLQLKEWRNTSSASQLFIKLSANAAPAQVEKQLVYMLNKNSPQKPTEKGNSTSFALQQFKDLHFSEEYGIFNFTERTANIHTLYYLLGIAGFLLLLGCINFVNLTTAQASQRAKEIGIRKTMGSDRKQLIFQFLSETFLITLVAVIISLALTPLILKIFADFIPKGVKADFLQVNLILFLFGLIVVVSFASGFYPAILLSSYKPVQVLKNQAISRSSQTRNAWLRKSLTVTQFVIAQFFIMATVLVSKQIYYALHKDLGFKKDAIVIINSPYKSRTISKNTAFLNDLHALPQVQMISVGSNPPSSGNTNSTYMTYKDGKKETKTEVQLKFGDENYTKLYGIKVAAGRQLQKNDTSRAMLINEAYAKELGFIKPSDALNKSLDFNKQQWEIVGVVHDFYQRSLRTAIKPLAIMISSKPYQNGVFHIALKP